MAQDPGINPSHDLDMVTIYESLNVDAEMEADMIHGILEATGIPSIMVRPAYPALGSYCVQVPREAVEAARRAIAEAQAAGPEAADEGEAESER
jgi:hypothetical protein